MELQNYTNYTPHTWLQDVPVKLTISNLRDGNNVLESLMDVLNQESNSLQQHYSIQMVKFNNLTSHQSILWTSLKKNKKLFFLI